MDIEQIRAYCLSKPHATEDFPFDETTLVFRVMNKIFASIGLDDVDWFCLKCDPEYAILSAIIVISIRTLAVKYHWQLPILKGEDHKEE